MDEDLEAPSLSPRKTSHPSEPQNRGHGAALAGAPAFSPSCHLCGMGGSSQTNFLELSEADLRVTTG